MEKWTDEFDELMVKQLQISAFCACKLSFTSRWLWHHGSERLRRHTGRRCASSDVDFSAGVELWLVQWHSGCVSDMRCVEAFGCSLSSWWSCIAQCISVCIGRAIAVFFVSATSAR